VHVLENYRKHIFSLLIRRYKYETLPNTKFSVTIITAGRYYDIKQDRKGNVTLRRVRELLLPWKSNTYNIFISVCACACVPLCVCVWGVGTRARRRVYACACVHHCLSSTQLVCDVL
jgi:hypothetical protein